MGIDQLMYTFIVNEESYQDGQVVIEEGGHGRWAYIVLEGQVKVKRKFSKGMMTIDTLKEGDILGEMVLFDMQKENKRSATVYASGEVTVGMLDTDRIQSEWAKASPQLKHMISNFINRLRDANQKAVDQMNQRMRGRLS